MKALFTPRPTSRTAAAVLRRVFRRLPEAFAFRLWDGSEVRVGQGEPRFTCAFKTPGAFTELMRAPTPYRFAVAYVESRIDLEGDLFAAMATANAVEDLDLSLAERVRLVLALWRG